MGQRQSEQAESIVYFALKYFLCLVWSPLSHEDEAEQEVTSRALGIDLQRLSRRSLRLVEKTGGVAAPGERSVDRDSERVERCRPSEHLDGFLHSTEITREDRRAAQDQCAARGQSQRPLAPLSRRSPIPLLLG